MERREGYASVLGFDLFYRQFGDPTKGDVLGLHGGPGATHDYLLPLADLASHGYRVTLYDQLGCGRSQVPKDPALFVPEHYVEEVEEFRREMNLGRPHLIGSSWGGLLAIAYALKYQRNMSTLTTVGGLHSVPLTVREMQRMKKKLPAGVQKALVKYETLGEYENPEYADAVMVYYKKHLCRLDPWPAEVSYSLEHISKPVYGTMNGPNEFTIIGNIRYWDVTSRLRTIRVPALILGGRYDEVSPVVARELHRHIRGSELTIFPKSSHLAFWEERSAFMKRVVRFLGEHS
ncbi:MAG: proline iminopeptidase-family hydrolase [Nitrososphaerota archaeon]|nr:proline iminopeptidase-family hydrolase [Nitrososphaerota archaeon]MDG6952929.1 proline iminopeptidase-family hydrolase [Nitrososphaerota archaeon]MDG6956786.1 proline iminopeptidase-family hydrolase [Nitrososphaerota archaeon]MDG6958941.1 proline iminopeptidase-family hydrolase [Nitrososphaerota archaeon]MDG6971763.1 proline iminopeptidase-family hydrolase [Nitrososphaerota archaeon]